MILDLAAGIGTTLVGILEAKHEFKVNNYTMCEVDLVSRGIAKGNACVYREKYGDRLGKEALGRMDAISQYLFELSRVAEETFRGWTDLPNMVMAAVPTLKDRLPD